MAKVCEITGKRPVRANHVSHSNIKTPRRQLPNLHKKRFWSEAQGKWITLRVSARAIRTINKLGIDAVLPSLQISQSESEMEKEP